MVTQTCFLYQYDMMRIYHPATRTSTLLLILIACIWGVAYITASAGVCPMMMGSLPDGQERAQITGMSMRQTFSQY